MTKKIVLTLAAVLGLSSLTQARDMVFVGQDYPPFNWEENKNVTGGMTDVMREVCKDLKHNCTFKIVALARALKMLEDGEVDGVMSLIPNSERAGYSNFSPSIIVTNIVYMASNKSSIKKINDLKELASFSAAGVRGSSSLKFAKKHAEDFKGFKVTEEVDNNTLVQRLNNGLYGDKGLIIGSEDVLGYFAAKEKAEIHPVYTIEENDFMVAFGKKKVPADELAAFNKKIEELKKNGTVKKILDKYKLRTK